MVLIAPFADEREHRERCGMQKNGFEWDTADALCQSDPSQWIAQLLATELRASGFAVLDARAAHDPSALRIEGSLLQLFIEPVHGTWTMSHEADLSVRLHVSTETGLSATRTFFVKGWVAGVASTESHYRVALERASQGLLREVVGALQELMRQYPQPAGQAGVALSARPRGTENALAWRRERRP